MLIERVEGSTASEESQRNDLSPKHREGDRSSYTSRSREGNNIGTARKRPAKRVCNMDLTCCAGKHTGINRGRSEEAMKIPAR